MQEDSTALYDSLSIKSSLLFRLSDGSSPREERQPYQQLLVEAKDSFMPSSSMSRHHSMDDLRHSDEVNVSDVCPLV